MKFSLSKAPGKLFWTGLIFCTLFVSYRYPLQMGTSTTSPTYSDTPPLIQVSKFVIVFILCLLSAKWALKSRIQAKRAILLLSVIFLQLFALVKASYAFDMGYVNQTFWPLAAMVFALSIRKVTTRSLDSFMRFLLFLTFISDAIELIAFFAFGRLPEQGYPNSIVVRFGGWFDSPNDFSCIIFLLMGWSFFRYKGFGRVVIEGGLIACLILTQSLTAYGFFLILLACLVILHIIKHPKSIIWLAVVSGLLLLFTTSWLPSLVLQLMNHKAGSIAGHIRLPENWLGDCGISALTGTPTYQFYEDWWLSSLVNLGVPWLSVFILTIAYLIFLIFFRFRQATNRVDKSVLCGFLLLALYCALGSLNNPVFDFFPANFIFYLFCFLVSFGKLQNETVLCMAGAETAGTQRMDVDVLC